MKHVTDRRGYIIVETAIFLPVFILAVISMVYYMNIFSVIENVAYSTIEETARAASKASIVKFTPGFTSNLKTRVKTDNLGIDNYSVDRYRYLYWDGDMDKMISVDASYCIGFNFPMGFEHSMDLENHIKCRGFSGLKTNGDPMSFDEMETEGSWEPVWVFPASGEKYHSPSCSYVKANAREMVLTENLKDKYDACRLCGSDDVSAGSFVYCFTENGTVYHKGTCTQVKKYTVEMNKKDAVDKGYAPCSKCGGG